MPATGALFRFDQPGDYLRVREVLRSVGYHDGAIVGIIGEGLSRLGPRKISPLLRRTSGASPLETMIRLFIIGVTVDGSAAGAAVAPMTVERWVELGLLEPDADGVRATVQLRSFEELVVAFDFVRPATDGGLAPDYVMGISPSTLTLASHTIRRPNASTLDLGTGSGFHALLAARHSDRVVATDRNPRAVEMAAFNAALNGLANIEARTGDLFEPVAGQTFDLIVSNPPFIISPDFKHLFLTTELKGDELCQRLAREAPALLSDGGWCQFLTNWAVLEGQPWDERVASWFSGGGCDVWVNQKLALRPDDYAATWIETGDSDVGEFSRFFDTWMSYYEEQRIEAVGFGLVTMRKRSGDRPNWFRADNAPEHPRVGAGEDVERCFGLHDLLDGLDDAGLLELVVTIGPDVRIEQECVVDDGAWRAATSRVVRTTGLGYRGSIDEFGATLLSSCHQGRTVRDLVGDVADGAGQAVDAVAPAVLANLRNLIGRGMLLPATSPAG